MRAFFQKLDDTVLRIEAILCMALLAVMSSLVFLDVVHRVAASPEGRIEVMLVAIFGDSGFVRDVLAPAFNVGLCFLLLFAALRTAKRKVVLSAARAALYAAIATVVLSIAARLFVWALPNGLIWAQSLSLAMMLWVGFLGASIATKVGAHLVLEIADYAIPPKLKPYAAGVGNLVAMTFCAFLTVVSFLFVRSYYEEWVSTDGLAGTIEGLSIPKFVSFGILPISFFIMSARFLARAMTGLRGEEPPAPVLEEPRESSAEEPA